MNKRNNQNFISINIISPFYLYLSKTQNFHKLKRVLSIYLPIILITMMCKKFKRSKISSLTFYRKCIYKSAILSFGQRSNWIKINETFLRNEWWEYFWRGETRHGISNGSSLFIYSKPELPIKSWIESGSKPSDFII